MAGNEHLIKNNNMSTQIQFGDTTIIKSKINRYKINEMTLGYSIFIYFDTNCIHCSFVKDFGKYCSYMERSGDMLQLANVLKQLKNLK